MSVDRFIIGQKVIGKVVSFNKPYFEVMVDEQLARVFIKDMDTKFISDEMVNDLIDKELEFIIEEIVENAKSTYPGLILNRRILLEEEIKKAIDAINVGDVLEIDDLVENKGGFNFVYNNIRGFIPLKEISYKYYGTSKAAKKELNLPIKVKVTSIDLIGGIYNIVGSIKATLVSPMDKLNGLSIGDVIEVNELVANKGGANFAYNEARGFIPLKEISHDFVIEAKSVISNLKYPIKVKVIEIEDKGSHINIIGSIKANTMSPEEVVANLSIGDKLIIEELDANKGGLSFTYKSVRGFIPISEVSHKFYTTSNAALSDVSFPVTISITDIIKHHNQLNIIGSIKANLDDLFTTFTNTYKIEDTIEAKIVRQEEYGYIIEFINGYRTLLHISEFSDEFKEVGHVIGENILVKLVNIDYDNKQIGVTSIIHNS